MNSIGATCPRLFSAISVLLLLAAAAPARAQTVTNILSFNTTNGSFPADTTPVQGRDGLIYGMANAGGTFSYGTIWAQSVSGTFWRVLYNFDFTTGAFPQGGLMLGTDGKLYGVTPEGGTNPGGGANGVVFKITTGGEYTVLHNFAGGTDGCIPEAPPIEATDGNLYGTTSNCGDFGQGTAYKIKRDGTFTSIHQFTGNEGRTVFAPLMQAIDSNLWGTAYEGGKNGCGTVFKMSTGGAVLNSLSLACDAESGPHSQLIQTANGDIYGTAVGGGLGYGAIFKLTSNGVLSTVYQFLGPPTGADFSSPTGGIMQANDGNFYGTTLYGGANSQGGIYSVSGTTYAHVYDFGHSPLINQVTSGLVQHTNGKFYSAAGTGGKNSVGSVFKLDLGLGAFVALVKNVGRVGTTVQVLGQGFSGTSSVTFNGVAASAFTIVSDTYLAAVVPTGASTGPVVVTTPGGVLTSNRNFRVTP